MYIIIRYIALSYRRTLYTKITYTNYFISSLNIFIDKTPVPNSSIPFTCLSIDGKPYYSSSLFLNKSIDPTNISL